MDEKKIAKIIDTFLGIEDHGCFSFCLILSYGDSCQQGFGPYTIKGPECSKVLIGILSAAGVREWEKLKGRTVFAIIADRMVRGIEPLPTEPGAPFDVRNIWPEDA